MKLLLSVIGLILIIEGLPYFTFPDRIKIYLAKVITMPSSTLRIIGLASIMIGVVLVYIGRA
ncbi:MAG: hypothetical protein AVO39_00635 [delta proteobacterium MLS_D]|jgi:uncharacterized protein|nr:MAG: hypothetical protein AVO39_00635 [delta proteobacterium MLS_D]